MPSFNQIKAHLSNKTVGIAGAGGLGSNCAAALIRCGVGKLIVADYDVVAEPNLNRQFYFYNQIGMKKVDALRDNLLKINPWAILQIHDTRVTPQNIPLLFSMCDVVVEAFDDAEQKYLLIEYMVTHSPSVPLVAASGMAGWGNLDTLNIVRSGNLIVCGDSTSEVAVDNPPLAPRVGVVANMEADVVLEFLLKDFYDDNNSQ